MKKKFFPKILFLFGLVTILFCTSFSTANAKLIAEDSGDSENQWRSDIKKYLDKKGSSQVNCPDFKFNALNKCKDKESGVTCYYVRADNASGSMALSCVKD